MSHEYFVQTVQTLCKHRRYLEAVSFCEETIAANCWPQLLAAPSEVICRYILADVCYYYTGDGQKARENFMKVVDIVNTDKAMTESVGEDPPFKKIVEDIYLASNVALEQLSISYEEYFLSLERENEVRPLSNRLRKNMEVIRNDERHGVAWALHVAQAAGLESREPSQRDDASAASKWSLLLLFPELKAPCDTLNTAIDKYTYHISNLIGNSTIYCMKIRHPVNGENYLFIAEKAIKTVRPFLEGVGTRDKARESLDKLSKVKLMLEDRKRAFESKGYHTVAPAGIKDFIPPGPLRDEFERHLLDGIQRRQEEDFEEEQRRKAEATPPQPPLPPLIHPFGPAGCLVVFLLATAICGYYGVTGGTKWLKWVAIVLTVVLALIDTLIVLAICHIRKKRKEAGL
ncbi:MAG: hypothetical protein LBJ01_04870 [Tannerella sp.]|jgi:hypothetical protein|nr:hypothetical protein [Tannerella sp.]